LAEARNAVEHRRLAGAVGPDQGMDRPLLHIHGKAVERAQAAEADGEVADREERAHGATCEAGAEDCGSAAFAGRAARPARAARARRSSAVAMRQMPRGMNRVARMRTSP